VPVRKDLRLAKERNSCNGRGQDNSVVNQIPKTQDSLQVRRCGGLYPGCSFLHPIPFPLAMLGGLGPLGSR
jgi:hypothetical protein